jgi:predicted transcriptional regulator
MVAESKQAQKLYETDYYLWVIETVKKLQNRELEAIDWENLIDEVSELGRREKKKLKSLLRNLWEHLLKLKYWQSEVERNQFHWKGEIRNFRKQIQDELEDSPSLKNYLHEILGECYEDAKQIVSDKSQLPLETFPESAIAPLEQVLDENWFPFE